MAMAKKKSMPPWMKAEHEDMMANEKAKASKGKGKKKKMGGKAKKKAAY